MGSLASADAGLPLVLLPGTLCDERLFAPLLDRLKDDSVIAGDIIVGDMGLAASTPGLARALLATLPPRFALAGFSLGGIVALEMAAQAPRRVARLALLDTTARPDPASNAAVRRQAARDAEAHGTDGYILGAWDQSVAPVNRGRADLRDTLLRMARAGGAELLARQGEVAINRADSRPRLPAIEAPTLVLAGEHDAVCPVEAQREMARAIPGAEMVVIPDAGHFAPLENPDAVAHHISRWLHGRFVPQPRQAEETT